MNNKVKLPLDVQKAFNKFDRVRLQKDPEWRRFDLAMQTLSTKASQAQTYDQFATPKMICEPEITYLIDMMKLESEKWSRADVLEDLHKQLSQTAR